MLSHNTRETRSEMAEMPDYSPMVSPGYPSTINTASKNYRLDQCSPRTPPSESSVLSPQMYSRSGRFQHIKQKLSFWKKKPQTASDVHSALKEVIKSHEAYRKNVKHLYECFGEWAEYLVPSPLGTDDTLKRMMVDDVFSEWLAEAVESLKPTVEHEKLLSEFFATLYQSFEIIKKDEINIKYHVRSLNSVERKFFKSMASEWRAPNSSRLDLARKLAAGGVEQSSETFHQNLNRLLPPRFTMLLGFLIANQTNTLKAIESLKRLGKPEDRTPGSKSPPEQLSHFTNLSPLSETSPSLNLSSLSTPDYPSINALMVPDTASPSNITHLASPQEIPSTTFTSYKEAVPSTTQEQASVRDSRPSSFNVDFCASIIDREVWNY